MPAVSSLRTKGIPVVRKTLNECLIQKFLIMEHHSDTSHHPMHYRRLALMAALSFVAMFILMYSMVNTFQNVFINVNQFYMAGLMTAPMVLIEIVLMSVMYKNKKLNLTIIFISLVVLISCYFGIRRQVAVSDKQFLRSMIPHHAGAILMCEGANITDPEIKKLCEAIVAGQQKEVDQMKAKLKELE